MRCYNRFLSLATACVIGIGSTLSSAGLTLTSTAKSSSLSAIELVDAMGLGWNLGNTYDSYGWGDNIWWNPDPGEAWDNPSVTKEQIDYVASQGFSSIRIPITWTEYVDATTYDIDDDYLATIKEVVDYCYDNDLYVIINMHWDWISDGSHWLNAGSSALTQFTTMWTEIATYFKDYDDHLVFEDMNEVTFDYTTLNTFNQTFVDLVRSMGGNNATRLLLVAGSNTNLEATCCDSFVVPTDAAHRIAVSIHYYLPALFTVGTKSGGWGYSNTWGTAEEIATLYNDFLTMSEYFVSQGVPVILGEYGAVTNDTKETESIAKFIEEVATASLQTTGITAFLWDSGNGGDMQYINRKSLTWYLPEVQTAIANALSATSISSEVELVDRIVISGSNLEALKDGWTVDLTPYKDLGLTITEVILEGQITGNPTTFSGGGGISVSASVDGDAYGYTTIEDWYFAVGDTSKTILIDGYVLESDATYEIEFNYLNVTLWWTYNPNSVDASIEMDSITVVFDRAFYTVADSGLLGDVNQDGVVNAGDASEILVYCAKIGAGEDTSEYDSTWCSLADFNEDGIVNAGDASEVLSYAAEQGAS